ncbi:TIGR00297 family protein [Acaryochloris sp. CCMEE 5410]|uniref:TIGR00297 family protein n=1 Tax=Acaryochloris sp. CCMEE 5410 TaxID=310037 RepID=UPI0002483B21|nr:TIGR00297 family protein [Acaryochloris sp. CCMEE 5410]KAI9133249.1 TIGR00297 family protein [Acaryochloris sp. CCMEE 5410]
MTLIDAIGALNPWLLAALLNTGLGLVGWKLVSKLLTPTGLVHAWILGVIVWGVLGWPGYGVVLFYFLAGSAVTKVGMAEKEAAGIAEKRSGARGPENVWGSAASSTLCALATLVIPLPYRPLLCLGYVSGFSTKLSDTTASEIGKAYGNRTFLITTLRPVPRGTEGAVSLEGTVAGMLASVVIALLAWAVGLISGVGVIWCVIAAFIATNLESVIGATVQSQFSWLTNEVVNGINTLIGAVVAMGMALVWTGLIGN